MSGENYEIRPIGRVVSGVEEGDEMPVDGAPASIEVFPEYEAGLSGIESNTHLIILGWFHRADRERLTVSGSHRRRGGLEHPHPSPLPSRERVQDRSLQARGRGVFGMRSPGRPNPVGLTSARVMGVEGRVVKLDRLDMIDGTPVVDIKRYSPGWDSIFSARTARDTGHPGGRSRESFLRDMLLEAENFHGKRCVGAALGARMVDHAIHRWGIAKKEPDLKVAWGPDGSINDALQAITGATSGNGRLHVGTGEEYALSWRGRELRFRPRGEGLGVDEVLGAELGEVLGVDHSYA